MKITALAGGVGGAKLVHGLSKILTPADLKIIVNTADDFIHYGLNISPDLDTVCYTIAELNSIEHGWGRKGETFRSFSSAVQLGGPDWFTLGDLDLGLHLERTRLLRAGKTLSEVTRRLSRSLGIQHVILPMSDDRVSSIIVTKNGEKLPFQEYFVKNKFAPKVKQILFDGLHNAKPTDLVLQALAGCDTVIICPSNPFVSIGPILALPGVKRILKERM